MTVLASDSSSTVFTQSLARLPQRSNALKLGLGSPLESCAVSSSASDRDLSGSRRERLPQSCHHCPMRRRGAHVPWWPGSWWPRDPGEMELITQHDLAQPQRPSRPPPLFASHSLLTLLICKPLSPSSLSNLHEQVGTPCRIRISPICRNNNLVFAPRTSVLFSPCCPGSVSTTRLEMPSHRMGFDYRTGVDHISSQQRSSNRWGWGFQNRHDS